MKMKWDFNPKGSEHIICIAILIDPSHDFDKCPTLIHSFAICCHKIYRVYIKLSKITNIYLGLFYTISCLVISQDDHITVVFFPGFQLATGKKGRFLYDSVRAGSQPALED